jgi:DNA gyrase subunit A
MRLQRLTGMERQKIEDEYAELVIRIRELEEILGSEVRLMGVVREELVEVREEYGDERRTRIVDAHSELTMHDLVVEED